MDYIRILLIKRFHMFFMNRFATSFLNYLIKYPKILKLVILIIQILGIVQIINLKIILTQKMIKI